MSWLDQLDSKGLRYWLRSTAVPMLASLPDGTILWANEAYERLTGYTWSELERMTWIDLTDDVEDRNADIQMVLDLQHGDRTSYQIRKRYRHKTSQGPQVLIDVMRYPLSGEFECCLVSVIPLDRGYDQALHEVEKIHQLLSDFIELQKRTTFIWDRYWKWAKEHPIVASVVTTAAAVFILGDRLLEVIAKTMEIFSGGP